MIRVRGFCFAIGSDLCRGGSGSAAIRSKGRKGRRRRNAGSWLFLFQVLGSIGFLAGECVDQQAVQAKRAKCRSVEEDRGDREVSNDNEQNDDSDDWDGGAGAIVCVTIVVNDSHRHPSHHRTLPSPSAARRTACASASALDSTASDTQASASASADCNPCNRLCFFVVVVAKVSPVEVVRCIVIRSG